MCAKMFIYIDMYVRDGWIWMAAYHVAQKSTRVYSLAWTRSSSWVALVIDVYLAMMGVGKSELVMIWWERNAGVRWTMHVGRFTGWNTWGATARRVQPQIGTYAAPHFPPYSPYRIRQFVFWRCGKKKRRLFQASFYAHSSARFFMCVSLE